MLPKLKIIFIARSHIFLPIFFIFSLLIIQSLHVSDLLMLVLLLLFILVIKVDPRIPIGIAICQLLIIMCLTIWPGESLTQFVSVFTIRAFLMLLCGVIGQLYETIRIHWR